MESLTTAPFSKVYFIFLKRYVKIFYPSLSVTRLRYTQTNAGVEDGKKDASSPVASATSSGIFCDISSSTKTLSRTRHAFFLLCYKRGRT